MALWGTANSGAQLGDCKQWPSAWGLWSSAWGLQTVVLSLGTVRWSFFLSFGCRVQGSSEETRVAASGGRDTEQVISSVCVLRSHLRALQEHFRELHHQVTYIDCIQYRNVTRSGRIVKHVTPLQTTTQANL